MASTTTTDDLDLGKAPDGGGVHPEFERFAPVWTKLRHVYDGTGGFLDGTYLVAHPREWLDHTISVTSDTDPKVVIRREPNPNPTKPTRKLKTRRTLARYDNIAAPIIEQKLSALFRQAITRTTGTNATEEQRKAAGQHPYEAWVEDCDGYGTHLTDFMMDADRVAMIFGHAILVMDRPVGPVPISKAEQKFPVLRLYSPLDCPDWLLDANGTLTGIALMEAVPRTSLEQPAAVANYQRRIITDTGWSIKGGPNATPETPHDFGRLPVVTLYAKRHGSIPFIGNSILGDPKRHIDLFNLTSELRELLRNQTFGILNVPLGTGDAAQGVEQAQLMMGTGTGTDNVLFSSLPAQFISPESANVTVYQQEREDLVRMIYRTSNTPFEADSRDAESEGSLALKREDFNQGLSALADECERAEYALAELFFRAHYGVTGWEAALKAADLSIGYPDSFDPTPFAEQLEQAQALVAVQMPHEVMQAVKRDMLPSALPSATPAELAALYKAIEAQEDPEIVRQREQEAALRATMNAPDDEPPEEPAV